MHFVGANAVLAISHHLDGGEPLVETKRTILKDRANLRRELLLGVLLFALPHAAGADETNVCTATGGAVNTVRPTKADNCFVVMAGSAKCLIAWMSVVGYVFMTPT